MALEVYFEDKGIEVMFSECNGEKVLQNIESWRPHAVVMDVFMTRYDAVAVKKMCEGKPFCPKIFMAQGCYDNNRIINMVMEAGFDRYLLRPYDFYMILLALKKLFSTELAAQNPYSLVECTVSETLGELGIPRHTLGYIYLRQGITMVIKDPTLAKGLTKKLYPTLAQQNDTTPSRVERAIRNAIQIMLDRGKVEVLNDYFSWGIRDPWGRPTNREFISIVSDRLRIQTVKGMENMAKSPENR